MLDVLAYIGAIIVANLTATWLVPLPFGLSTTIGTLTFGATFTLRDRLHYRYGRRRVYYAIGGALLLTILLSLLAPIDWRIIGASLIGLALAEAADTEIFHRTSGGWFRRVFASNAVSVPLDTALFNSIAFLGIWSWSLLIAVSLGDMASKWLIASALAWWRGRTTCTGTCTACTCDRTSRMYRRTACTYACTACTYGGVHLYSLWQAAEQRAARRTESTRPARLDV